MDYISTDHGSPLLICENTNACTGDSKANIIIMQYILFCVILDYNMCGNINMNGAYRLNAYPLNGEIGSDICYTLYQTRCYAKPIGLFVFLFWCATPL